MPKATTLPQKKKILMGGIRASIDMNSFDEKNKTIEVVFASETPVRTWSWDGEFNEVLSCSKEHVRTKRFESGAPVLDNHNRYVGIGAIMGVVESFRFQDRQGRAVLKFSSRPDLEPYINDIKAGIIRNVSVGYRVHKYELMNPATDDDLATYRAIDWEPMEVSFTSVQADPESGTRSDKSGEGYSVTVVHEQKRNIKMNKAKRERLIRASVRKAGLPKEFAEKLIQDEKVTVSSARQAIIDEVVKKSGGQQPVKKAEKTAPQKRSADVSGEAAVIAERARVTEIKDTCRSMKLGNKFADKLINDGVKIGRARKLMIDKWSENDPNKGQRNDMKVGREEKEKVRLAMEEGLSLRAGIIKEADVKHGGKDFRGMSLLRMAEEILVRGGIKVGGMTPMEILKNAMYASRQYMSTSDFPEILGNTINRRLRAAYEVAPKTFEPFCRRTSAADFKTKHAVQLSGLVGSLKEVKEGGEYKRHSLNEGKESYALKKYGGIIGLTWEAMINDDLSAFDKIPVAIAEEVANTQSDIIYGILLANALMADGVALFDAGHGNLGTPAVIGESSLSEARKFMRKQTGLNGRTYLNLQAAYLICGPDKETEAQKVLQATIVATKDADTNVFKGSVGLIVDPRVTGNKWFMAANPSRIDTIEYATLQGEGDYSTESKTGFDVDGLEMKVRATFGAKAIDHRGLIYNAGA